MDDQPTFYLPPLIKTELAALTTQRNEVEGQLLYDHTLDDTDVYFADYILTGEGDEHHVTSNEDDIAALNDFLIDNPDYDAIRFHTHTEASIAANGSEYARNFSAQDQAYIDRIRTRFNPHYSELLVTPETITHSDNADIITENWEVNGTDWEDVKENLDNMHNTS